MIFNDVLQLNDLHSVLSYDLFFAGLTYKTLKPQIDTNCETILETGDNYTIVCQGNAPLDWTWPQDNVST